MARFEEPTPEQLAGWREWVASRPDSVRTVAERLDPWSLYRMKSTGDRVTIASFYEDGTVKVNITGEFNSGLLFDHSVFGIEPDDLEPCALPSPSETGGTLMTPDDVRENIDALRATIRPDLLVLDDHGKAVRRDN